MIGGRTHTAGKKDYAAGHALQDQYKLVPLSEWGKNYTPPDNVPLKPGVDTKTPVPEQVLVMSPDAFFNRLNVLLVNNPPEPADPATMDRIARLGIRPGGPFQAVPTFLLQPRGSKSNPGRNRGWAKGHARGQARQGCEWLGCHP